MDMGFFDRLFGRQKVSALQRRERPLSLQLLFPSKLRLPGTLSFVGEDLLLHGVLESHPLVALPLLLTTAICAITLFRAFQKTFLGGLAQEKKLLLETVEDLLPRERIAALGLFALVFVGGLLPGPLLRVREHAVETMVGRVASVRVVPATAHSENR